MFQVRTACFMLLSLWERLRVRVLSISLRSRRGIKPGAQAPGSKPTINIEPAKRAIVSACKKHYVTSVLG